MLPSKCAIDTGTRVFQYKILNNISYLNKHLYKTKVIETPLCSLCQKQNETFEHLFVDCTFSKKNYGQLNTYSMKSYCIIYFEHRNNITSIVKLCLDNTSRRRVFSVKLEYACDVISMFKINYTITFHGVSVL